MKAVKDYIESVTSGKRIVGRLERLAVERHLYDLEHAHARGYSFDTKKATAALKLFPLVMRHTKGEWAGKPFELSPNQAFIVWNLFGWRRKDGTRRFRHAYICIARKWGKSEFAAAIGLIGAALDDPLEPGAEVFCAATKEDQAKIVFEVAKQMVRQSDVLKELLSINAKSISSKAGALQPNSSFKPIGSDSKTCDGLNIHMAVLDEIHEWRDRHRGLYEKLTTAHGSRRQSLIVTITTAGDDLSDIWIEMDDLCVSALENFDAEDPPGDNRFAFIARLDEARPCSCEGNPECKLCGGEGEIPADDPFDEANWPKANPNFPVTPKLDFLQEQAKDAKTSSAFLHSFLRYHCNVRVSALDKAIHPATWAMCRRDGLSDWSEADVVTGGWDIGGQNDLGALGYCARFETGEFTEDGDPVYRYEIDARAYLNAGSDKHDLTREPWSDWVNSGQLIVSRTEVQAMRDQVLDDYGQLGVFQWAYDPINSKDFAQSLETHGIQAVKFHQNAAMWTEPINNFQAGLKQKRITHNGGSLLEWAATNMILIKASRGSRVQVMPDKDSSKAKIDPIVAVIMAFRFACIAPSRSRGSLFISG